MLRPQACVDFYIFRGGISFPCQPRPDSLHGDGALQTFALHITAKAVRFFDIPVDKQIGGGAAAAAIKSGPAVFTVWAGIDIQPRKSSGQVHIKIAIV